MRCPNCAADNIQGVDVCESCGSELAGLDTPEARAGFRGKLLNDHVGDLPLMDAFQLGSQATVAEAVEGMRKGGVGCALVVDEGKLVGIFNERHLLTRVLRKGLDPKTTTISAVMSPDPLELSPEDPPAWAIHCMVAMGFRHLPVSAGGRVVGYISVKSILAYLHRDVLAAEAV